MLVDLLAVYKENNAHPTHKYLDKQKNPLSISKYGF